jgi:hypothetical protein
MAEVDSGLEEMVELYVGHGARRYFCGADYAPVRMPEAESPRSGFS